MEILYHGHSCVQLTDGEHSVIIDPFISGNPSAQVKIEDIKVQYVLLTHGHGDHFGDAIEIARRNNATIIANHEIATYLSWQGLTVHGMNTGGSYNFEFGKVKLTQAFHSSGLILDEEQKIVYMGMPIGFLITMGNKTLYHPGDTALFGDMKMIGELNEIDVAFLPIGDYFTMGPEDALIAAQWINANVTIPIHYNTFPLIEQDGDQFISNLENKGLKGKKVNPGEKIEM